jgi:hypothetical protein
VIRQIAQFLGRRLSTRKDRRTIKGMRHYVPLSIYDDGITFGYARDGESINDLR